MQQLPVATTLFETIGSYLAPAEIERVQKAYRWAEHAHAGQLRQSGEPYLIHPVATARLLADYHLDSATLAAALLHDVCEDTPFTLAEIRKNFGDEIAQLVDGVTKLSQVRLKKTWHEVYHGTHAAALGENFESFDRHVETLRKMFIAMSQDIRVVLIKLADRLHNMETLDALAPEKQRRMAQETLEVYAPLADRLGIGSLKGRLRDLAFPYAFPDEYVWLTKLIAPLKNRKEASVERVRRVVLKRLAAQGVRGEAHGRAKHIYSLWKKLLRHDRDITKIYDLVATRVIVPTIEDCYRALGIIHAMWKPLPGRIKDYIATPKPNGYQSLHTTVFALGGKITEIQIRTPAMHHWAEFGIAAHWVYKDQLKGTRWFHTRTMVPKKLTWVRDLARLKETLQDPSEWQKGIRLDFFEDRIFVFTPIGDVLDLPVAATPIDFAYAVHSDLGDHCVGAKVNGRLVPLSHPLTNGDIVEIMTSKKSTPTRDWLQLAKTNKARGHIKRIVQPSESRG